MPSHKSCFKRMKTAEQERQRNRAFRSQLRNAIKDLRDESNKEEAAKKYRDVTSLLDKASGSHLIHRRNADRNKARLAKAVQKLG